MDAEFLEKVHMKDQTITVWSFCFLQRHGVTTSRPTSSIQLAQIEAAAIESEELSELPVVEVVGHQHVEQPSRTIDPHYRVQVVAHVQWLFI